MPLPNLSIYTKDWQSLVLPTVVTVGLLWTILPSRWNARSNITKGITDIPTSELKERLQTIYPESMHGYDGEFAKLPYGKVKYWVIGPADSTKKVVLIHGLTIPSFGFHEIGKKLASKGFRVLLYDLYGRGYTDAPDVEYTTELYITQTALLMQHLHWEKAYIVGLSMGGAIAAAFASTFPKLVDGKVVFIASAGVMTGNRGVGATRMHASPIGRYILNSAVWRRVKGTVSFKSSGPIPSEVTDQVDELVALQAKLLPGYTSAVASSIVYGPLGNQAPAFHRLGSMILNVLLIWGTDDVIVHPRHVAVLKKHMPQAEVFMIDGAGHSLTMTHSTEVADALIEFFDTPGYSLA